MTAALLMPPSTNQAFAEAVCHAMDNWRGQKLSLRQARMRTGIDIETLSRMRHGEVPRMDKVISFARGFELDPHEWLVMAGYESLDSPSSWFGRELERLAREHEHPALAPLHFTEIGGLDFFRNLTWEKARRQIASLEAQLRAVDEEIREREARQEQE